MPAIRHVVIAVAALAAATTGIPAGAGVQHGPSTVQLQAGNFRFCSASTSACVPQRDDNYVTTVPVGTRVTWTYTDHACDVVVPCPGHNVVFTKGFGSKKLIKSQGALIYRMTFTKPGRYTYFCTAHQSFNMTGTIVVTKR